MTESQSAGLEWRDQHVPVSRRFDDPYFSLAGGLDEARHVFLAGNELPARLRPGFRVGELGFGTGLNLLALAQAWPGPEPVFFTSFEAFALAPEDMARALGAFAELGQLADALCDAWARPADGGRRRFRLGAVEAEVILGDARQSLPEWSGQADAWFLDGFAPARNPELWEPTLLAQVARHTAPGGSFATYSAAGAVRRALGHAGFAVERVPGFAGKRHMSRGRLP